MNRNNKFLIFLFTFFYLFILNIVPSLSQQKGNDNDVIRSYKPPDIYNSTGPTIKLQKLDLNKANLQQLLALPEINEDLALKIIRRRPLNYLNDLEKLPYIDEKRMKIIIKGFSNLVTQQYQKTNSLKQ